MLISDGAQDSLIGGSDIVGGNLIANNGKAGIRVRGQDTIRHTIRHNRITANAGPGIALQSGGNTELTKPIIGDQTLTYAAGIAPPNSIVEVFSDPDGEGAKFEGSARADDNGYFIMYAILPFQGPFLYATATDADGNTSEFGGFGAAPSTPTPGPSPTPVIPPSGPGAAYMPYISQHHALRTTLVIEPTYSMMEMGQTQSMTVVLKDVEAMYGTSFVVHFDPTKLEVLDENPAVPACRSNPAPSPILAGSSSPRTAPTTRPARSTTPSRC